MESKDTINKELIRIGLQKGYRGEMVELAANLLTYVLYHNQVEIANMAQESSLATAKKMSSKIKKCMDYMYSVFRGNNARVILNFKAKTQISVNKYDLVYESNTFKLYAADNYTIAPYVEGSNTEEAVQMECVFSTVTKYVFETSVSSTNRFYIDVLDANGHVLGDISEEVRVFIDDVEYPITRDFYDHVNCSIPENTDNPNDLDKIFVLTTPGFGIRIFKRGYYKDNGDGTTSAVGYFPIGSNVRVECLHYTKGLASNSRLLDGDINPDEFNKILIPGTVLVPFEGETFEGYETGRKPIDEVPRETENSILYNANLATRVQSHILSNSDVCHLFSEYFISTVKSAGMRYDEDENGNGTLLIFYIPRIDGYTIPQSQVETFREKYKSYFITTDIEAVPAELGTVELAMEIYTNDNNELSEEIENILSQYTDVLTERSNYSKEYIENSETLTMDYDYYNQLINLKIVTSQINKLDSVHYVSRIEFESLKYYTTQSIISELGEKLPTSTEMQYIGSDGTQKTARVPMYYRFKPIVTYKYAYESLS